MKAKVFILVKLITLAAVLFSTTAWVQPANAQADWGGPIPRCKG